MSVHPLPHRKFLVRWRDTTGRQRSKTFSHGDGKRTARQCAYDFHDEVRHTKRHGSRRLEIPVKTLGEVATEWEEEADLAKSTATLYVWLYERLIAPTFEDMLLSDITARDVERWLSEIQTGPVAKQKAAALLSQLFNTARRWGWTTENPVELAKRPKAPPKQAKMAPSPRDIEEIRTRCFERDRPGDAYFISALAYAGLRPQEAMRIRWSDVQERTILINAPKTGRPRAVKLLRPLAADLAAWKLQIAPTANEPVFPNTLGRFWTTASYNSWRARVWWGTVEKPGVAPRSLRPYDCRHLFASLLIHSGMSVVEVAQQLGHSPQVCLSTYAHVFAEADVPRDPEQAIREARTKRREAAS